MASAGALPDGQGRASTSRRRSTEKDGFRGDRPGSGRGSSGARASTRWSRCARRSNATPGLVDALAAASRLPDPPIGDERRGASSKRCSIVLRQAVGGADDRVRRASDSFDFVRRRTSPRSRRSATRTRRPTCCFGSTRSVQHLLVDEFQDTSLVQLEMLRRLTAGWQPDDGRTLFAVGDPMQSIYRFREAEVRFFLDAQRSRHDRGACRSMCCACGGTSARRQRLVEWSNARFRNGAGQRRAIPCAARSRSSPRWRRATRSRRRSATVDLCATLRRRSGNRSSSASARRRPPASARSPCSCVRGIISLELLPALRQAQIAFAAVELDRLSRPPGRASTCVALTHALLQPADRTAWLAVLRAPWCGLSLAGPVCGRCCRGSLIDVRRCCPCFATSTRSRACRPRGATGCARGWTCWLPRSRHAAARACRSRARRVARARRAGVLDDPLDLDAANLYFELLQRTRSAAICRTGPRFAAALDSLRATPGVDAAGVQVMTMHKAKGLQFDTVILPGLAHGRQAGRRVSCCAGDGATVAC